MKNRLYRGVDTQEKELVFGSLIVGCSCLYICIEEKVGLFHMKPVEANSIGVSLGIKDNEGTILFEGDKIKSYFGQEYELVYVMGEILAEDKNGFLYPIKEINKPVKIGGIYEKFLI